VESIDKSLSPKKRGDEEVGVGSETSLAIQEGKEEKRAQSQCDERVECQLVK